jgi:hypothetical protein
MKAGMIALLTLLAILSLYAIIIIIQKIRFDASAEDTRVKKGAGWKYWVEPYRHTNCSNCSGSGCSSCSA